MENTDSIDFSKVDQKRSILTIINDSNSLSDLETKLVEAGTQDKDQIDLLIGIVQTMIVEVQEGHKWNKKFEEKIDDQDILKSLRKLYIRSYQNQENADDDVVEIIDENTEIIE